MLKGLTVWYLLHKTFKVEPHHRVLIHAAAGGIGLLACQWARAMGAHVIGTVGSKAKADLALANGCDHVILYNEEDFVARVKQISRNELCDVVYDGVGKTTFPGSLSCLKPRGLFVSFGNASGPVPPFAIAELNNHGSLFATRPKLNDYVGKRKELLEGADTLFAAVINGKLHVPINHAYALKDAAKAHIDLEAAPPPAPRSCGRNPNSSLRVRREAIRATGAGLLRREIRYATIVPRPCSSGSRRAGRSLRDLLAGDVERRHEAQRVRLRRVQQHAVLERLRDDRRADRQFEVERQQQARGRGLRRDRAAPTAAAIRSPETARHRTAFQERGCGDLFEHGKPAAHISGLPLKVPPWSPCSKQAACSVASSAASGTPPPMPLPSVMMSGSMPACS
jgi:hypothetical protein